jgi:hypothetical protein
LVVFGDRHRRIAFVTVAFAIGKPYRVEGELGPEGRLLSSGEKG